MVTKTFLCQKQGDYLSLGSWSGKRIPFPLVCPPSFSYPSTKGTSMQVVDQYKEVPSSSIKLQILKHNIIHGRANVKAWEAAEPNYPLLSEVKAQLAGNLKVWAQITGGQPCQ